MNAELRRYRALAITLILVLTIAVLLFSVFLRLDMSRSSERLESRIAWVSAQFRGDLRLLVGQLDYLAELSKASTVYPQSAASLVLDGGAAKSLSYACLQSSDSIQDLLGTSAPASEQGCPTSADYAGAGLAAVDSERLFQKPTVVQWPPSGERVVDLSTSLRTGGMLRLGVSVESVLDSLERASSEINPSVIRMCLSLVGDEKVHPLACRGRADGMMGGVEVDTDVSAHQATLDGVQITEKISTGTLTWQVDYLPDHRALAAGVTAMPFLILGISLTIGALACWFAYSVVDKNLKLEEQSGEQRYLLAKLEHQNNELDQFAVMAAHDLQSPLRFLSSNAFFLKEELDLLDRSDLTGFADNLIEQSDRMRELVIDLHEFCRAGHEALAITVVDVDAVINSEIERIRANGSFADVSIEASELPKAVSCDRASFALIIDNLIANAVTYARDDDGVHISITARQTEPFGEWIFRIEDDGPGIDLAFHQQVFQPFRRLDVNSKGTGIGLAIVARLVSSLGGEIWIDPDISSGCAFCFSIPDLSETRQFRAAA